MLNIPIVIAAYNRVNCLERLLQSLVRASFPVDIELIISVDGGGSCDVVKLANDFIWPHGTKKVIIHDENLGLKNHILKCGKISKQYDGVILLEDDLYVSPCFYSYILNVESKYADNKSIAGIALYSHLYNETACLPFSAITDEFDVYFMQLACSWGQCWLTDQWREFEDWYSTNNQSKLYNDVSLPPDVLLWPDTSWKKYFIKYMIESNKFFVYPRISLVTNFGDSGQHHDGTRIFQVPLLLNEKKYVLPDFEESKCKYDAFCEILPESLKHYAYYLNAYDFEVDLYGMKNRDNIRTKYVLTRQESRETIKSFGREIKPHEVNIIENIDGDEIRLTRTKCMSKYESFLPYRHGIFTDHKNTHEYYYAIRSSHHYDMFRREIAKLKREVEFLSSHNKFIFFTRKLQRWVKHFLVRLRNKILAIITAFFQLLGLRK